MNQNNEDTLEVKLDIRILGERKKEIFNAPETKNIWESMLKETKLERMVTESRTFANQLQTAIIERAIETVVTKGGCSFDEAIQEAVGHYKEEFL